MPAASYSLQQCDLSKLFNDSHKTRHPLALYNISLSSVARRFETVLEALNSIEKNSSSDLPFKAGSEHPLLEATDHLLDSLMEHMEDCESILESFFEDPKLKQSKKAIEAYKRKVAPYRDHIGKVDNFIKHNQGRLRLIVFYEANTLFPGYFIEGLVSKGVVGPSPVIHPNADSAFSYARDLRFHLVNIYGVSRNLTTCIQNLGGFSIPSTAAGLQQAPVPSEQWLRIIQGVSALTSIFYPDEVKKPFPSISMTENHILIRFPDNAVVRATFPNETRVASTLFMDGVTRSYKLPYAGNA